MKPSITIREPIAGDIGWIISMHGMTYTKEFRFDQQFELDIAKKLVTLSGNPKANLKVWLAEVNGHNAGSMAVSSLDNETGFVNFVLVLNQFRSLGIAKALMNKIIGYSRTFGYKTLRLETYSCLEDARILYQKTGFVMVESTKNIHKYSQTFDQEFWKLQL